MTIDKGSGGSDDIHTPPPDEETARRLISAFESVAEKAGLKVTLLEDRQEEQEGRQRRHHHIVIALTACFALLLGAMVAIILMGAGLREQAREIEDIQERVTGEVLCPLYQQFLNADTPRAREMAKAAGQDMEVRDHAFSVIRDGYRTLGCESVIKE